MLNKNLIIYNIISFLIKYVYKINLIKTGIFKNNY